MATHAGDGIANGSVEGWRFAADVGGTFTDVIIAAPDGRVRTTKVLSTPHDYSEAVFAGVRELAAEAGCEPDSVTTIVHATTVATNAILERKGRPTGLITTRGFRDVLELRRIRFPETYNLLWDKPRSLIERRLRREVTERIGAQGEVVTALDLRDAGEALTFLVEEEHVAAVAVCLLNSYLNPAHEQEIERLISTMYPDLPYSLSSDVLPEIKEYERTSTTSLNAYLKPVVSRYIDDLQRKLGDAGYTGSLYLMQSSGGVMPARAAAAYPIHLVESGAAAGVIGGCELIGATAVERAVTFDMGGTTAKACLVENGTPLRANEYEVGGSISLGSRLLRGGGDLLRVPAIDVVEVGAGAGSIVDVDAAGVLHVGPQSAGASPGPICYRQGGTRPTVTDANVALGYLPQNALLGGSFPIVADAARAAIESVGEQVGLSMLDAALGIHQIANASMARAIRSVSTERGRDLRRYPLIVFGGSGPVHAVEMARTLGIVRVIVPRWPGVFSALGLLYAPIERRFVQSFPAQISTLDPERLDEALRQLEQRAVGDLGEDGYASDAVEITRSADLHYRGQWHELDVRIDAGQIEPTSLVMIEEAFEAAYEETYGYRQTRRPVDLVNIRIAASVAHTPPRLAALPAPSSQERDSRLAYFGSTDGPIATPVVRGREALVGQESGPLIIDEFDSTIVVPPDATVALDEDGNVIISTGVSEGPPRTPGASS